MTPYLRTKALALALAGVGVPLAATAGDDHQQQAHVHGEAHLQVALEGSTADLILRSPSANLLGFEHEPKTAEQENALRDAREWLKATPLVQTPDNDCKLAAGSVHFEQDARDDHNHGSHDHDEDQGRHSDVEVSQQLECGSNLADSLTTPLTGRFPGIEHLTVEWISSDGQGHTELHAGESEIELTD